MKQLLYLSDDIYKHIYKYLKPPPNIIYKYSKSILWCTKCGELLLHGDWFFFMKNIYCVLVYKCPKCYTEHTYTDEDTCMEILDIIA